MSFNTFNTIAVDDKANAEPIIIDVLISNKNNLLVIKVKITEVIITCNEPITNTSFFICIKCLTENSNPIVNIKNTIPNSAISDKYS